jgi:uncharacterized RmlC-like cupin family protein
MRSERLPASKVDKPIVVRPDDVTSRTNQSPGAVRMAAIDAGRGASRIWMGKVHNDPGMKSVPHHHGDAETAGYVVRGRCRIWYGVDYREYVDLGPGDFVFVPANCPHIEANLSDTEPLEFITARSPENVVINLT